MWNLSASVSTGQIHQNKQPKSYLLAASDSQTEPYKIVEKHLSASDSTGAERYKIRELK